jgi:hypothetical protein
MGLHEIFLLAADQSSVVSTEAGFIVPSNIDCLRTPCMVSTRGNADRSPTNSL